MYYEITYNGDKDEFYLDAYKKWENKLYKTDKELAKKEQDIWEGEGD